MTVQPPQQTPTNKDAQAARKRRRRAPAGGAADDCFACIKRGTKCDRRRPYCSQCLEVGNECSGYKTQLTWGVGVASRGKLRGLSLPVAKSPPVAPVPKKTARSRASSAASSQWSDREGSPRNNRHHIDIRARGEQQQLPTSLPPTPFSPYTEFPRFSQPEAAPVTTQASWSGLPAYAGNMTAEPAKYPRMHSPMGQFRIMSDQMSSSVESLSDVEYTMSPMHHPYTREEVPFMHSPSLMYDNYSGHPSPGPQTPVSAIMIEPRAAPTSCPGLVYAPSEHSSSLGSHHEHFETHMGHRMMGPDSDSLSKTATPAFKPSASGLLTASYRRSRTRAALQR